jgi:heterotetrameric sarcosine oxidase gamma subunit
LLSGSPTPVDRLRNGWAPELTAQHLSLVDLTPGLAVLELSGSEVRDVLAGSCGVDFEVRQFPEGSCARTRLAQIPVVIDCIQGSGTFELYVPRSYESYLTNLLLDAAGPSSTATQ